MSIWIMLAFMWCGGVAFGHQWRTFADATKRRIAQERDRRAFNTACAQDGERGE